MVSVLFIINLAFSLILATPLYRSLENSFGSSMVGENMAEGFDYLWWQEFRDQSQGLESTFRPSIIGKGALLDNLEGLVKMSIFEFPASVLILGLFYIILHTFLAGGVLSVFSQEKISFTMKGFFSGSGKYFLRFLLLMLVSWIFFAGVGIFVRSGFYSILDVVAENARTELAPFYLDLLFHTILFFLILFIQMVFDYARIQMVVERRKNVILASARAFRFVFKHAGSTLGLYYLLFLCSVALSILYVLIKGWIPQAIFLGVLLAFLIQQLFIFALIFMRCWLYSSELELYRYLT